MQFPFSATWRDPDEPDHAEPVTVLGVNSVDPLALACRASERRGVLLSFKRGDKGRRLLAEQVWADDENSANATWRIVDNVPRQELLAEIAEDREER